VSWIPSSGAKVADLSSSETTVSLSDNATVKALFVRNSVKIENSFTTEKLIMKLNPVPNRDSVIFTMKIPAGITLNSLQNYGFTLYIDGWKLLFPEKSQWENGRCGIITDAGKIDAVYDERHSRIVLKVKNTSLKNRIDSWDGVRMLFISGDRGYSTEIEVDEKTKWKMQSASHKDGFDAKITYMKGLYYIKQGSKKGYSFVLRGEGLPPEFDASYLPSVTIDGQTWQFLSAPIQKNSSYIYSEEFSSIRLKLILDTAKRSWVFSVKNKNMSGAMPEISRTGNSNVVLSFGIDDHSVNQITSEMKTTVKYTEK
jgi:hypothetical protein